MTITRLRSLLFVPGDRPERMRKALGAGADALILVLEDSVAPSNKDTARREVAAFLTQVGRDVALFVRVNALDSGHIDVDLDAVLPGKPTGIVLPKAEGGSSLAELEVRLRARSDLEALVLPIAVETPRSVFHLAAFADGAERLVGLTWGAEDLSAAVGSLRSRVEGGHFTMPFEIARTLVLFAATAAGVTPIETVYSAIRDLDGLAAHAARAAEDGFTGMLAVHPAQVPVINAAFSPSAAALREAQAIVDAFAAEPGAGVLTLAGKMIDGPHLKRAQALLRRAA